MVDRISRFVRSRREHAVANEDEQAVQRPQNGQTGAEQLGSQQSTPAPSQEKPSAEPELNQTLQEQLTQAIRPVVKDLQQQIAQTIRQQMSQGLHPTALTLKSAADTRPPSGKYDAAVSKRAWARCRSLYREIRWNRV